MNKYRKKPLVIEAIHYTIPVDVEEVLNFLEGSGAWYQDTHGIVLPTLEGEMLASPGDWIIKGIAGEFYPCKPDIFEATYERLEEEPCRSSVPQVEWSGPDCEICGQPTDSQTDQMATMGFDETGKPHTSIVHVRCGLFGAGEA